MTRHHAVALQPVIEVSHLTKKFAHWEDQNPSLKAVLIELARGQWRSQGKKEFLALDDVSFQVYPGDFLGIMGKNGEGKSTLMKLITGIFTPTLGTITVQGVIAPLIELGAGFSGELSGLENIMLNSAILGFGRKATLAAIPQIIEFSELGPMIEMPVRNYSSGMLARLGFSIATSLTAPIILIDEVLSVGDIAFQEKSLNKIHQLHAEGRTILLISHDPQTIVQHCNRCLVLVNHKIVFDGDPEAGKAIYLSSLKKRSQAVAEEAQPTTKAP